MLEHGGPLAAILAALLWCPGAFAESWCTAEDDDPDSRWYWRVNEYPHPMKQPRYCNRYRASFVCDPDRVIGKKQEHHHAFLRCIDPEIKMRLPDVLPRRLETLYHRLRLNAALTKSCLFRLGVTKNPYCDNCGSPETVEHLLLEFPAYINARCGLVQELGRLSPGPITLKALLGPRSSTPAQRKVPAALLDYLNKIGVIAVN